MTTTPAPRRGWLRRNLVALVVLLIAIPGLVLVVYWFPTLEREQRQEIITVKQGDSITEQGYRFTLTQSKEFVGTGTGPDGNNIPIGSSLVGTIIEITPLDDPLTDASCQIELTEQVGGEELSWSSVSNPADFDYGVGADREEYCLLKGEAREVETVFLTPTGAYKHATLDVTNIGKAFSTEVYRFALVH